MLFEIKIRKVLLLRNCITRSFIKKFQINVSNASANLWPKRVLNSTEASNPHSSGTHRGLRKRRNESPHEWPFLQPKLHPLKLCLGNAPLSPALIQWYGGK
ncbi:hypothetical protein CEXT_252911 [Caerostris extrusa]|uniref:Uncharacterized protein n=1 Tax=Caerostris extrusa TaxID=172846 RepID=A0AAV4U6W6_CAEEX|nr:hypothetical protein CEXT_252911 [Caerostris extrusa]